MLKGDGTPVKPAECTRDLLEVEFPDVEETDCPLTYLEAWYWGVSLGERKCSYGVEYEEFKIPTFVLMAPKKIICGFFDGLCSTSRGKEKWRRIMSCKEHALRCQYLAHRVGLEYAINLHAEALACAFEIQTEEKLQCD